MEPAEYRSRNGRIVVDRTGIELVEPGTAPLFVPWHAVGHMEQFELERGVTRVRLIRVHLADGRKVPLPAPSGRDAGFDRAAAEIFRVWRRYSRLRIHEPQDEIPPDYRAATARKLDPIRDAVQDAVPARDTAHRIAVPVQDAVPLRYALGAASPFAATLRRWMRRRARTTRERRPDRSPDQ